MKEKIGILLIGITLLVSGCSLYNDNIVPIEEVNNNDFTMAVAGVYDSKDTAIVIVQNAEESTITLQNIETGKRYTLYYDGTTEVTDKFDEAMSIQQIKVGDVVEVTFYRDPKRLNTIKISPDCWVNSYVEKFAIDEKNNSLIIVNEEFELYENVVIFSEGREIEREDINESDILAVTGIDRTVVSLVVIKGHGYLRLENDSKFIDGWIEVGQTIIQLISENMLLLVPEGDYQVVVSHKGGGGTKEITIERDREVVWDIGELEIPETKSGNVLFSVSPSTAVIYVDGEEIDSSKMLLLEYGVHQLIVKNEDYITINQYINVGEELGNIDIEMEKTEAKLEEEEKEEEEKEKEKEEEEESEENETIGGEQEEVFPPTVSDNVLGTDSVYKIHVEGPVGVEVYFNNTYVGIAPIDIVKTEGSHVITLRQTDHETRSYTIQVDSMNQDISYAFSPLEPVN